ncbi:MAG: hypothetical protein V1659_03310 [Candidatus Woesearchaeota archaeon]
MGEWKMRKAYHKPRVYSQRCEQAAVYGADIPPTAWNNPPMTNLQNCGLQRPCWVYRECSLRTDECQPDAGIESFLERILE